MPKPGWNAIACTGYTRSSPVGARCRWHLNAKRAACAAGDGSRKSTATRPSVEPVAHPVPSGKARTTRVGYFSCASRIAGYGGRALGALDLDAEGLGTLVERARLGA